MSKTKQSRLITRTCTYGTRIRNRTGRCFCPHCVADDSLTDTATPDRESFDPVLARYTTTYSTPAVASAPLLAPTDLKALVTLALQVKEH